MLNSLRNPTLLGTVIVLGLLVICWEIYHASSHGTGRGKAFFSDDDGQSYFTDDFSKLPPWDHNGKTAVGCAVYSCDGGKHCFVAFLRRYPPEVKAALEGVGNETKEGAALAVIQAAQMKMEVKKPLEADNTWAPIHSKEGGRISAVACPDKAGVPRPVTAE